MDSSSESGNDSFRYFKLLRSSSSNGEDSDEQGGQIQPEQFTIGLISDCQTVKVHAGKCFKALIDPGYAISLMCTNVYNMIEDHYKTCLLPAALTIQTADESPMSPIGKGNPSPLDSRFQILTYFCHM